MSGPISLRTLLELAGLEAGDLDLQVEGLCTDSRRVQPGDLFIGMPGTQVDGGRFWPQALAAGAVAAVVSEVHVAEMANRAVIGLPAERIPQICGQLAAAFYDFPSRRIRLVGVTGTNGKTTTTHLLEHILNAAGQPTALLGTLYNRWPGHEATAEHTTAFAPDLQRILAAASAAGCQRAVLEVSSHSLAQQRVWGCQFAAAVWTNLTQDHLDFHATMEDYWQAKALLFGPEYLSGQAIINQDDAGGRRLLESWPRSQPTPWSYSLQAPTSPAPQTLIWPAAVELDPARIRARLHTPLGELALTVPLPGSFNLANVMGAVGAALHLGLDPVAIEAALPGFAGVPGRMESIRLPGQDIAVIVDYAHTPDGLENVLRAVRPSVSGALVCVFGCGGDRDRTKRPQMGRIAAEWADRVVVTSDNPRTEDPQRILADIVAGMGATPHWVDPDRRSAITAAICTAAPGDTVVIAGKGHEDYQILGQTKYPFDDRQVAREALGQRSR